MRHFDFIVVGGGSAGAIAASRLASAKKGSVLLIEAGRRSFWPLHTVPIFAGVFARMQHGMWQNVTEPEARLGGRQLAWPHGRVLGGSSAINGMVWMRGRPSDYDGWERAGADGWGWSTVAPVFDAIEGRGPSTGPHISIMRQVSADPLDQAFVEAAQQAGLPRANDFNDPSQEGAGYFSLNVEDGRRRFSTEYLDSKIRRYLNVRTNREAIQLHLAGSRVEGVTVRHGRTLERYSAGRIILCCGAINTPKLLMLSGIGDPSVLERAGVKVIHDLPGVGRNMQDHLSARVRIANAEKSQLYRLMRIDRASLSVAAAAIVGKGRAAVPPFQAGLVIKSSQTEPEPDLQALFLPGPSAGQPWFPLLTARAPDPTCFAGIYVFRPESRGQLSIRSSDPDAALRIEPNYLSTEGDRERLKRGVQILQKVMGQSAFAAFSPDGRLNDPDLTANPETIIKETSGTAFHYSGTCRIGREKDRMSVVSPTLHLHGMTGLSIADASVMPSITSGNTNAPSMMIGYRAADLIE